MKPTSDALTKPLRILLHGDTETYVRKMESGVPVFEGYYLGLEVHRDPREGPALVSRDPDTGMVFRHAYFQYGKRHRDPQEGPAVIIRSVDTGEIIEEAYFQCGKLDRDEELGPAEIHHYTGPRRLAALGYYRRGKLHRRNGPALVEFDPENSVILNEVYRVNNRLHRDPSEGPAMIERDTKGDLIREAFYFKNVELSDKTFDPPLSKHEADLRPRRPPNVPPHLRSRRPPQPR